MTMTTPHTPETSAYAPEEILLTLRALAGLVAEALRRSAASGDAATFARERPRLAFWRAFLLRHTQRLLPALVGAADEGACRAFVDQLVRAVYVEDAAAIARHGCDPATCAHPAHWRA